MEFWIFMLIMDLLLPFTMIGSGRYFMKKAPKEINSVFGYRTSMSMKNKGPAPGLADVQSREPVAPPPVPVLPAHVRVKPMSV